MDEMEHKVEDHGMVEVVGAYSMEVEVEVGEF